MISQSRQSLCVVAATVELLVLADAFEALTHMFHSCESSLTRAGLEGTSFVAQLDSHATNKYIRIQW